MITRGGQLKFSLERFFFHHFKSLNRDTLVFYIIYTYPLHHHTLIYPLNQHISKSRLNLRVVIVKRMQYRIQNIQSYTNIIPVIS